MLGQYVCKNCGYNMINNCPEYCPFCGANKTNFITAEECSQNYRIVSTKVKDNVTKLNSYPSLGFEHSAYSIEINGKHFWIDCPSIFSKDLEPMDKIFFTHHHFLGASNLYRGYYTAFIWIHWEDSEQLLAKNYPFDKKFKENFKLFGIEAFYINGHTLGFTFYVFEDVLFICDYLFLRNEDLILNPYGPEASTKEGATKLYSIIKNKNLEKVCGFNYVMDYSEWIKKFMKLYNLSLENV
jgi:hydroxyacylglutathione hydrolase